MLHAEYEAEKLRKLNELRINGHELANYTDYRKSILDELSDKESFIRLILDYLKTKLTYKGRYYECENDKRRFIDGLELTRHLEYLNIGIQAIQKPEETNSIIINFHYSYVNRARRENLDYGNDKMAITILDEGERSVLIVKTLESEDAKQIINEEECRRYVEDLVLNRFPISNSCFRSLQAFYDDINRSKGSLGQWIIDSKKRLDKRLKLINNVDVASLYCYLIFKDIVMFEMTRDVIVSSVSDVAYKEHEYVRFVLLYTNVFNNINIQFNDQYKIALYLFDNVVRKGIRAFEDALELEEVDGIAFQILATDKNVLKDSDIGDAALYEFYLSENPIRSYIDDEITGRELADMSYILFDGERIDLLTF